MDISGINAAATNITNGIQIGDNEAPIKIIEFINLRCPYCRQWHDEKKDLLAEAVASGKVQRIIKLFDKEKPGLAKGNVMHRYIPQEPVAALAAIDQIYASQDTWGDLEDHGEIAQYAKETLGLTFQEKEATQAAIVAEAAEAGIIFVPTMVVGTEIFDQKITNEELAALLA